MLPTGGGDPTGEAALGAEKDPVAGKERTGTTRRRTLTMRSPRVAGAEEGSRDLTVLAMSGAEENLAMTRALPPQETRLTARGKTEDVAEAEEDSEVVEGSGVGEASEAVAEDSVEASEVDLEGEEVAVTEEATEGCPSEAAEEEAEAHHSEEAEAAEKVARDSNHELNITLKTKFGKFTLSSSTPKLFWAFSRDLFSTLRSKHRL